LAPVDRDALLTRVAKPARYLGEEHNSIRKDHASVAVTVALAFPDSYEVGMSHLGLRLLYDILNGRPDCACERVFAPWPDMAAEMKACGAPLWALESGRPVAEFDVLGFSLQHELNFTNVLYMLDLAGVPLRREERGTEHPLVIGGGPAAFNPEPMADFFDLFVIGDGEAAVGDLVDLVKRHGRDRAAMLLEAAGQGGPQGFYVPGAYEPAYNEDGTLLGTAAVPSSGARPVVTKAIVADLGAVPYPERPLVPFIEAVHDRVTLEICRGCTQGCRFCQAGMIYRPVRERPLEQLMLLADTQLRATGYDEISLASLSASDYSAIGPLVRGLVAAHGGQGIGISLPSLRTDSFSVDLAAEIQKVRKTGLTFAPEAGTERLRRVINKNVTEEDLLTAVTAAFRQGWDSIKLYFMIGLPTETDEDVAAIAELARRVWRCHETERPNHGFRLAVSCATFVPKAHTPFQWDGQTPRAEIERRQALLRRAMPKRIKLSWHDVEQSILEAALARGDRRLSRVIEAAYLSGCRFDAWDDQFHYDRWLSAFAAAGLDMAWYAERERREDEALPWDHIDPGVSRRFLWRERQQAERGMPTLDCRQGECHACGICGAGPVAPRIVARAAAAQQDDQGEPSSG